MDAGGFVLLSDIVPDMIQEIRYYSTYNFTGDRIDGYEEPCALLTKEAAQALRAVSDDLIRQGFRLKIYDAYRPVRAVRHFVRWAEDIADTRMKACFYPDVDKEDLFAQGYIAERSSHSRGSTVDLTLIDMKTGRVIDTGTPFDLFSRLSWPSCREVTQEQYGNRMFLRNAMKQGGFAPIESEWWHFTLEDEPYPDTYFDFPVSSAYVKRQQI
ncbi:MAG: M15 family metallopeptidase [Solobacterium sp.]|nr:M15 family metallopeptidase [Solobacterium sp.]